MKKLVDIFIVNINIQIYKIWMTYVFDCCVHLLIEGSSNQRQSGVTCINHLLKDHATYVMQQ